MYNNIFFKSSGEGSLSAKIFLIALASLLAMTWPENSRAQSVRTAHNSVYLELLGNGALYSMNYDRMFSESVGGRIGVMYIALNEDQGNDNVSVTFVPVMVNYLVGEGKHKLELGLGALLVFASGGFDETGDFEGSGVGGTATFGYRLQPPGGGFVFRVGFTPIFSSSGFLPWGGASFGFGF
jgi:hypothetical protein